MGRDVYWMTCICKEVVKWKHMTCDVKTGKITLSGRVIQKDKIREVIYEKSRKKVGEGKEWRSITVDT